MPATPLLFPWEKTEPGSPQATPRTSVSRSDGITTVNGSLHWINAHVHGVWNVLMGIPVDLYNPADAVNGSSRLTEFGFTRARRGLEGLDRRPARQGHNRRLG